MSAGTEPREELRSPARPTKARETIDGRRQIAEALDRFPRHLAERGESIERRETDA